MADVTFTDLKQRTGVRLGIVAESENLAASDAEKIAQQCISVQAQLELMQIASFVIESGLEEAYADPFIELVSAQCADIFGIPEPQRSVLSSQRLGMPGRSAAERRMRNLFLTSKLYTKTDITAV